MNRDPSDELTLLDYVIIGGVLSGIVFLSTSVFTAVVYYLAAWTGG